MDLFDNHTHLNDLPFRGREADYLARAKQLGVTRLICAGQDPEFNLQALALAKKFAAVYAMVGYCPDVAALYDAKAADTLTKQLSQKKVVALGEIGLDYYWNKASHKAQQTAFKQQLDLAFQLHLPVNIHTRDAWADTLTILKQADLTYGAVLHNFNGGPDLVKELLPLNVNFSYSGVVSFTKATAVHESAKIVPRERLLVETDAPYLTPKPYRGKQNEPGYVYYVAQALAKLRQVDLATIAKQTYANTVRIYGINEEKTF